MPNFKFSDLTNTNFPTTDSVMPCVQNGVTKQISILQIKQYLDDGTLRELSSGEAVLCNPNPITSTGTVSFYAPGLMSLYAGATAPSGWLLCNGASVAVATYQDLFNNIGYTYGGSGANFNLPNTTGRAVFGLDNMGAVASAGRVTSAGSTTLGATTGSYQTTLTQAQAPLLSHTHSFSGSFVVGFGPRRYGNNNSLYTGYPRSNFNTSSGQISTSLTVSVTNPSQPTGVSSTDPHPNLPPFVLLNWIIKT